MFDWLRKTRGGSPKPQTAALGAHAGGAPEFDTPNTFEAPRSGEAAAKLRGQGNDFLAQGQLGAAVKCYRQAAALDPQDVDSRVNLGYAQSEQGLFGLAVEPLRQAIALAPDSVDAHFLLAAALRQQGQFADAVLHGRRALALRPSFAVCRQELCRSLLGSGDAQAARQVLVQGLAMDPDDADLHHYLGNLHTTAKDYDAAITCFERALAIQPHDALILTNFGHALHLQGRLDAALALQQQALAIQPDLAEAHFNLGSVLQAFGRLADAEQCFRQSLAAKPGYVDPLVHLGIVLQSQGRREAAADSLRAAIALAPDHAEAHNNLATVLIEMGRSGEAIDHLHRALRSKVSPQVHCNLGAAFERSGHLDEAIDHYRKAVDLEPGFFAAHSNLLFVLSFHPTCSPADYLAEARIYGAKLSAQARPYTAWLGRRDSERPTPLRVGLVSGDLKSHPVGYFIEGLLRNLDLERFELVAYATHVIEDDLTGRLKPFFKAWTSLYGLTDKEAAVGIHDDGIDILIDLSGHTAHNRLPVFAWRPAPVQITWLGYFASTGAPGIEWLIADPVSAPEHHQEHFSESIWHIPDTRLCFNAPHETAALAITPLPAVSSGHITFGCFQASSKIGSGVMSAWSEILHALPSARLRVQNPQMREPSARAAFLKRLNKAGIGGHRVALVGAMPRNDYLAAHAEVDMILDTFPYPGGTTTCEALWMGVPTMTLAGETMLARQGASLLTCAGLTDWVADDVTTYVRLALGHAANIDGLAELRKRLRRQVLASALFDAPRFARRFELALQGLWNHGAVRSGSDN